MGTLKASLSSLDTSLADLHDGSAFDLLSIDAPAAVDITQTGAVASGQYSINVNTLAAAQVLASSGLLAHPRS